MGSLIDCSKATVTPSTYSRLRGPFGIWLAKQLGKSRTSTEFENHYVYTPLGTPSERGPAEGSGLNYGQLPRLSTLSSSTTLAYIAFIAFIATSRLSQGVSSDL